MHTKTIARRKFWWSLSSSFVQSTIQTNAGMISTWKSVTNLEQSEKDWYFPFILINTWKKLFYYFLTFSHISSCIFTLITNAYEFTLYISAVSWSEKLSMPLDLLNAIHLYYRAVNIYLCSCEYPLFVYTIFITGRQIASLCVWC